MSLCGAVHPRMFGRGLASRLDPTMLRLPILIQLVGLCALLAPNPIEAIVLIDWCLVFGVEVKLVGVVEL